MSLGVTRLSRDRLSTSARGTRMRTLLSQSSFARMSRTAPSAATSMREWGRVMTPGLPGSLWPAASRMPGGGTSPPPQSARMFPPMSDTGIRDAMRATRLIGTVNATCRFVPPSIFRTSPRYPRTRGNSRSGRRQKEIARAAKTTTRRPTTTARTSLMLSGTQTGRKSSCACDIFHKDVRSEPRPPGETANRRGTCPNMPHFITDTCIGCGVCEIKCPTHTITGDKSAKYVIHEDRCIDCSVCARYCPVSCIQDHKGLLVEKVKPRAIPNVIVARDMSTGCEFCIDICPFDCIYLIEDPLKETFHKIAEVEAGPCVSCRLCETVCEKDAIFVPNPITQAKRYLPAL